MNTKVFPVLIVVFMLIFSLSGCIGDSDEEEDTITGEGGIEIEFQPGAPPEQISEDDESFDLSVKLENTGEYDIPASGDENEPIYVFLLGVNPDTIGLCDDAGACYTTLTYELGLSGAHYVNQELIPGELTYKSWVNSGNADSRPFYDLSITSDQQLNFVAQVCYPYKTIATADACFSDNAYAQATGAETCEVSGEKDVTNTLAPVQVTKIVENPAGKDAEGNGRYAFTFTVENVGGGTVFSPNYAVSGCTDLGVSALKSNQVFVESVKVGNAEKTECLKSDGTPASFTLVDDVGTFTCTLSQASISGDYSDIIEIKLGYNYYSQTKKSVTVKNTLDF